MPGSGGICRIITIAPKVCLFQMPSRLRYGKLVHIYTRRILSCTGLCPEREIALEYANLYVTQRNQAQRAVFTWILVAHKLRKTHASFNKDVVLIIARMIWKNWEMDYTHVEPLRRSKRQKKRLD